MTASNLTVDPATSDCYYYVSDEATQIRSAEPSKTA